jgi:hypothetical protein
MTVSAALEEIDLDSQIVEVEVDPRWRTYRYRYSDYKNPRSYDVPGCVRLGPDAWQPCRVSPIVNTDGDFVVADTAWVTGDIQPTREAAWLVARKAYLAAASTSA